jgi:uncharacterized protein YjdB
MMNGTTPITTGYTAEGANLCRTYTDDPAVNETVYFSANSGSGSKYYAIQNLTFPFKAVDNQESTPNLTKVDVSATSLTFTTYRTGSANAVTDVVDTFTLVRLEKQEAPKNLTPVAPTNIANTDGKITGAGQGMEYKPKDATVALAVTSWVPVTGNEITGLIPGTYLVRYAAKTGFLASEPVEVSVPAWDGLGANIGKEQKSGSSYKRLISAEESGAATLAGKFLVIRFTEKGAVSPRSWSMIVPGEVRETTVWYYGQGTMVEVWITDGVPTEVGDNMDVKVFAYTKSDIPVQSISLSKTSLKLYTGQTKALIATINPADASNKAVTWSSSNVAVAKVDENGVVTAVAPGGATITVTTEEGGKSATCAVTVVKAVPVTSVRLSPASITIRIGRSGVLTPIFSPTNASNKNVSWNSSDTSFVSIDGNGRYTGLKLGTAVITVKTEDGAKTATCTIRVIR